MSSRWQDLRDDEAVEDYDRVVAERLAEVRRSGGTEHAEAELVAWLHPARGAVLDAGCGTGRVSWPLARMGYEVTGVDSDPRMLQRARGEGSERARLVGGPVFLEADLASYRGGEVDVVLAAGNVVPLLAPGSLIESVCALASQLRPDGLLVWGFGLREQTLPEGCPPTPIEDVEAACDTAGLHRLHRWGTWERQPFAGEYVVEVHVRADEVRPSEIP